MTSPSPSAAETFKAIVGEANFQTSEAVRQKLSRTTLPQKGTLPCGVIYPQNREEVQRIVSAAHTHRIPLYPISTGKNWGYGDACAPQEGYLIVDLSRMNRILEVNTELAYAVIEPGVTQGQLSSHLAKNNIPLIMDCTGAGPDASLIGNIMERGFGHSAYGDRFAHSCNYEIVLPDGSLMYTGFGSSEAQGQNVYKWGIGPALDGLFTQSNMGIITRMTVWLMLKPERLEFFFIALKTSNAVGDLVEALRRLRLEQTIRSMVHVFNSPRLLAGRMRFPWDQVDGSQALEKSRPDLFKRLCAEAGLPAWGASGVLTGNREQIRAAKRRVKKEISSIAGVKTLVFMNETRWAWARKFSGSLSRFFPNHILTRNLQEARLAMDMLLGKPSYDTLKGSHWRSHKDPGPHQDVLESESGLLWISPVLPATKKALDALIALAEPLFHEFGFEFQTTVSCTSDRALSAIMSVCFDRSNASETARAKVCGEKLVDALLAANFIPYRGSADVLLAIRKKNPAHWQTLQKLKAAWDPQAIIAPQRYIP